MGILIEIEALRQAFFGERTPSGSQTRNRHFGLYRCAFGSVKTSIGTWTPLPGGGVD